MVVNSNIISEFVRLDENILNLMNNLRSDDDELDRDLIIKYIKMFLKKEKRISSQIPDDLELINSLLENLYSVVLENVNNENYLRLIMSRISNIFNKRIMTIKPSSQYVHVFNGQELFVKDRFLEYDYNLKGNLFFDNLCIKYLKNLEDLKSLGIYDNEMLSNVLFYNLFINSDLFDNYISNGLNVSKIDYDSDEKLMADFGFSSLEFKEFKGDVISSMVFKLFSILFNCPKDSVDYVDAQLNFKFYISELPLSSIKDLYESSEVFLKTYFESMDSEAIDNEIILFIENTFEEEIKLKSINSNNDLDILPSDYKKLQSFVNFELELLGLIQNNNFYNCDSDDINKINSFLRLEEDFVNEFSNYSEVELCHFFTNGIANILGEDFNGYRFKLISYRLMHRFSSLNFLNKVSSQDDRTYNIINRNYIVSSVKNYYSLIKKIDDDTIRTNFLNLYKDQFFMNPDLTELFVFYNGNHDMIEPFDYNLSVELSGVDEIEFDYDLCDQLFPEMCNIINELFMFKGGMEDTDNAYFQFRLLQFNYLCGILDLDSLNDAMKFLTENFDSNNAIFTVLYNLLLLNINDYDYKLDIEILKNKTKINIM